jgi:hypothetical protein
MLCRLIRQNRARWPWVASERTLYMKRVLVLITGLAGSQAQALSCLAPDPVRAFQYAMAAPETYVVLRGTLAEAEIYNPPPADKAEAYAVPVWFSGMALTLDGFTQPLDSPMTVQITCAGPWCGSMPPDAGMIIFAQLADGAYTIEAGPCDGAFFEPDPAVERLLTSCIRGEACVPADAVD